MAAALLIAAPASGQGMTTVAAAAQTEPACAAATGTGKPAHEDVHLRASWVQPGLAASWQVAVRLFSPKPLPPGLAPSPACTPPAHRPYTA